ncbi:acireductone synthase [Marinomonas sp. 15G1-11]|uniref:Enolase-phosphatase E1 n=1 Tax=Marinomonas phaeophyticola TaxID=3004091 RepID=A0ABT4JW43_9GAMM|nr:acireductone synthase [Marinomonas sp. 15G1-11]MCZ2722533.1 acireductone synthase [Marinomonas sp. 15G1-11]
MIKAILTDIEGTTSKISFVHEVLFPYARQHMAEFIKSQYQNEAVTEQIEAIKTQIGDPTASLETIIQTLEHWIDTDKKITPLKALQGMIWKHGYEAKEFTGHVYQDAFDNLTKWQHNGLALYVYSSGSVAAQKLIFGYSDFGDMTALFTGYFDTKIGLKQEAQSYENIIEALPYHATEILFLSDVVAELNAAANAGMQTYQLIRESQPKSQHPNANSFDQITIQP